MRFAGPVREAGLAPPFGEAAVKGVIEKAEALV
jgi:hypothetical protein